MPNSKGKVRMECAVAIHFMRNRGWEKVMDAHLQHLSLRRQQVGGFKKVLGVSVQDMVGEFCKHVCVHLAFRLVPRSRLGAALKT